MKPDLMQKLISICEECGEESVKLAGHFFHEYMEFQGKKVPIIETYLEEPNDFECKSCGNVWYIEPKM